VEFYYKTSEDGEAKTLRANRPPGNYYIKVEYHGDTDQYAGYELSIDADADINPTNEIAGLIDLVGISIISPSDHFEIDMEIQLSVAGHYSDATAKAVEDILWFSLDPDVASVDQAGVVTGVSDGIATIMGVYGSLTGQLALMVGTPPPAVDQHHGNLILVAGGGAAAGNTLRESTQYLSDLVYRRFRNRLFTDEDIYYFNPITWHDVDGDGYGDAIVDDEDPTVEELSQSITAWAAEQSTDGPLYIFLIDHGGIDTFKVHPGEILTAAQLDDSIDAFQAATDRRVVVIIEACKSGSFTDDIVGAGQDRIAVTSTDDQDAYLQLQGRISFTQFFVDRLLAGDSVREGYLKATNQLGNMGLPYAKMEPQLVEGSPLFPARQ